MVYEEFLRAAGKHLKTCTVIRDSLNSLDITDSANDSQIKLPPVSG